MPPHASEVNRPRGRSDIPKAITTLIKCIQVTFRATPLGALSGRHLAGADGELDVEKAPNLTPHPRDGIGSWAPDDLAYALRTGIKPDGDTVKTTMGEVVMDSTDHLTGEDLDSIARYLLSLPPLEDR